MNFTLNVCVVALKKEQLEAQGQTVVRENCMYLEAEWNRNGDSFTIDVCTL